jgi:hypothetical protein
VRPLFQVHRHPEMGAHKRVHARLRRALCAPRRMHGPGRRPSRAASRPPQGDGKRACGAPALLPHAARGTCGRNDARVSLQSAPDALQRNRGWRALLVLRIELSLAPQGAGRRLFDAAAPLSSVLRHPDVGGHKGARAPLLSAPDAPQKNHGRPAPAAPLRAELSLAPQNDGRSLFGAAARLLRVQRQPEVRAENALREMRDPDGRPSRAASQSLQGDGKRLFDAAARLHHVPLHQRGYGPGHPPSTVACRPAHEDGMDARRRDAAGRPSACRRRAGGDRASLSLSTPFAT